MSALHAVQPTCGNNKESMTHKVSEQTSQPDATADVRTDKHFGNKMLMVEVPLLD